MYEHDVYKRYRRILPHWHTATLRGAWGQMQGGWGQDFEMDTGVGTYCPDSRIIDKLAV